jgi:hypothetical protein
VAATLSRATAGAGPVADIPLQVSVAPFAVPGSSDADVILVLGMRYPLAAASAASPPPAATRREQIAVIAGAYDRYARPRASDERMLTLSLPADATGEVAFESLARLTLRPGSYEVRVAASSATGTPSGSVFTYVDVPAFASAALSLSGLVLEAPSAQPAAAGDVLEGRLPVVPTSRRTFGPADPVTAFLRIYQGGNAELRPVEVTLRLVASWGEVALERLMPFSADRFGPNRSADLRVDLPLIGLAAGEYLLAIEAREGDRTADRQLRLIVQGAQGR